MSHRYRKRPSSIAMYRHFAVLTVVCTSLLAIFADGENANALEQGVESKRLENEARQLEKASAREAEGRQSASARPSGSWGSDGDLALRVPQAVAGFGATMTGPLFNRYSPDQLARMSVKDREELIRSMAQNGADGSSLAGARGATMERASRLRSGSVGVE